MAMTAVDNKIPESYPIHDQIEDCEKSIQEYWDNNPEIKHLVEQKKAQAIADELLAELVDENSDNHLLADDIGTLYDTELRGAELRTKIRKSHQIIYQKNLYLQAPIIPRTQSHNRKSNHATVDEERSLRGDIVASQIQAWRGMLPTLIKKLSRIPDPRRAKSVKHKVVVLMVFGLFAFILKLSSRREMNRDLTRKLIQDNLNKLFPEINTIPHADTLARLLKVTDPKDIESAHINLIKDLIRKKKFKKLLINGCLPVSVDGTQKLYRNGLLEDSQWCEHSVGKPEDNNKQQYIYAIEANITLQNGLTIPLMTEYLYRENNVLEQSENKQDNETTAFERMAERLKKYFKDNSLYGCHVCYSTSYGDII